MISTKFGSYSAYKPSGVEWLGEIPAHWEVRRLRTLAANVVDQTTQRHEQEMTLALEHVESWSGRYTDAGSGMALESQLKRFEAGDVLFGKLRPYLAKVTCPDKPGLCVGEFLVLRPRNEKMSSGFLQRVLCSKPVIDVVNTSTFGAKMPRAEWQFIGNMEQAVPSFPEQTAIVHFLDHADGRIRRYIQAKQKLTALLEEQKQTIIHQAVTGQVDVRTGRPYSAYKSSGVEWLGDLPKHWETAKIKRMPRSGYKTFVDGDWIESPYITPDGVRLIQTGNIGVGEYREKGFRYISEGTFKSFSCTQVMPGDILICRLGEPVARTCIAPDLGKRMITSVDVCILKLPEESNAQFLVYSMSSRRYLDWVGSLVRGSTRDRVSRSMLGSFSVPFPPLDERAAIADRLDKATSDIDTAMSHTRRKIDLVQEYHTRLLADVVTGKLDVREAVAALPEVDPLDAEDDLDDTFAANADSDAALESAKA